MDHKPNFFIGQVIRHVRFGYRGVIIDVDPVYQGTEAWYTQVARSRPPKDRPWYHVLVHEADHSTYVAERHLEDDREGGQVDHPALGQFFSRFSDGRYLTSRALQ
ncbi:heat shock protein HspQ [Wenzhouxiangella limi]|uniref:Heat shock protein HspQ n=1 Tax=Wenzhouxiangella limi TaxID=2707351 RepID=A0A845UWH3_9GAMM|nr:heat shock protein HspQ [Wenzhouxiangella limi]NDY94170.1 heat shock protein HspQ [Wenzhouxiangella limi]